MPSVMRSGIVFRSVGDSKPEHAAGHMFEVIGEVLGPHDSGR